MQKRIAFTSKLLSGVAIAALSLLLSLPAAAQNMDRKSFNDGVFAFNSGDNETAGRIFHTLANDGDERAQYYLATMMEAGEGMARDSFGAISWFLKSAEAGYLPALTYMGYAYYTGHGVIKDETEAFKWYTKAARLGDAVAQNNLGVMLRDGIGYSKQDPVLAAQWFLQSATQHNARAQYNLGTAYRFGQGVKMNFPEALRWYKYSADKGDMYAQYALGSMYAAGQGVERDMQEAMGWYSSAAEQGHIAAQLALARIYETNEEDGLKNTQNAAFWYKRAAQRGSPQAQFRIGYLYETGEGVSSDVKEAAHWYTKAVGLGYIPAIGALCRLATDVTSNDSQVKELFLNGANAGDPHCQLQLGRAYEKGTMGVEKNPVEAYQWLALAASSLPDGDNKAAAVVSRIEIANTLTESQLSEARKKVSAWKPTALAQPAPGAKTRVIR